MFDLSAITVEPLGFFQFAALNTFQLAQTFSIYQAVCHQEFGDNITINCNRLEDHKEAQKVVQEHTANWAMYIILAVIPPALVADLFLGEENTLIRVDTQTQ